MIVNLIDYNQDYIYENRKKIKIENGKEMEYFFDGLSFENEFIPVYSLIVNKIIYNKEVIHYGIPWGNPNEVRDHYPLKGYRKFYRALENCTIPTCFRTGGVNPVQIYVMKGLIFELIGGKPNILFLSALRSKYLTQAGKDYRNNSIDLSKYSIFTSYNFATNPMYKTLYRKVYNEIVIPHIEIGVESIITNDIVKRCFNNNLELPKFKTLNGLNEYLRAFNKNLINE